jgi:diguanylate cyclase (GGDEF)-like protein
MIRSRIESPSGQAAVLFVVAGLLGLLSAAAVPATRSPFGLAVSVSAVLVGVAIDRFPWARFDRRATLALVPAAFGLLTAGQFAHPGGSLAVYGVWYVVVFAWIGSWHGPRTTAAVAPLGAATYVAPLLAGSAGASADAAMTVIVAIPAAVTLAEVMAAKQAAADRAHEALAQATALLERANLTDDLTGVGNRRRCNRIIDSLRDGDGVVLVDIDHFKSVNDRFGHAEGDRILAALGGYLMQAVREADAVARYGGEEFLVVFRGAGATVGPAAQRLLDGWRRLDHGVTISAGAGIHCDGRSPQDTFRLADAMLYEAKRAGRDRLRVADAALGVALP